MIRRFSCLPFCWLLIPTALSAQPETNPAPNYAEHVKTLEGFITREVEEKRLPALSIALVDDQKIVWARGFGFADAEKKKPTTADSVYRVGSVSKLFTDIAVMQLVEEGKLELDEPITKYLPDFKPKNPFGKPITLRMLMSHRSGLVREPPVGSVFDNSSPTLARTVESLNSTTLVYEPGSKSKYSNAAVAVVGRVLETTRKQPFAKLMRDNVFDPAGMKHSDFEQRSDLQKDLAAGVMWTYHGREFPAPTFELGIAPSQGTYSTVNDLGRFMSALFADGKPILKPESLKLMTSPQFAKKGETKGIGIGFHLDEFGGELLAESDGSIYGFAADLAILPKQKLGVVVMTSRGSANSVVTKIARTALYHMLVVQPMPTIMATTSLDPTIAKSMAGRYQLKDEGFDLVESAGRLWMFPLKGGVRTEIRADGNVFLNDDLLGFGKPFVYINGKLRFGEDEFKRIPQSKPALPKEHYLGLIGEYGWDHSILYIFEKDGRLHGNFGWFFFTPLNEESKDVYTFADPGFCLGEKLTFKRDKNGKATQVEAGSVVFKRRHLDGEDGQTFRVKPVKSVDELRTEALKAKPPAEKGDFRDAHLVEIAKLDATIKFDLRYAGDNNFLSVPLYPVNAKAYMQKPAAAAVVKANARLKEHGYGLLIHDAYRPWSVTKIFWNATPEKFHDFVADPSKGSRHNRGCAVDLTLYDLKTGKPIEMVGGFDEFSDRSYPDYLGGTSLQRWHRDLLRKTMESESFTVYEAEWWHFDFKDWRKYPIGNQSFDELERK